jgi:hypothetical protein
MPLGVCNGPVGGYAKIVFLMAKNTKKKKKGVKLKTQKQSYEVLVYKERLM